MVQTPSTLSPAIADERHAERPGCAERSFHLVEVLRLITIIYALLHVRQPSKRFRPHDSYILMTACPRPHVPTPHGPLPTQALASIEHEPIPSSGRTLGLPANLF